MVNKSGQATEDTLDDMKANMVAGVDVLGSEGVLFEQCEDGTIFNVDTFQRQIGCPGSERGTKIGHDDAISATAFEVLANANYSQPSADMQMEVVSSSAVDDDGDATGARVVRITYFNEAWVKKTTDVIMDGTTIVDTTATDIYRIESFDVIKGSPAVGTITLKDTTGTTLYGQIDIYTTFMERCMHYVETGKRCVLTDIIISTQTKEGIIFRLFKSHVYGSDIVTKGRYSSALLESGVPFSLNLPIVLENPTGLRLAIGLAVKGLAASQGGNGSIRFYCEDI